MYHRIATNPVAGKKVGSLATSQALAEIGQCVGGGASCIPLRPVEMATRFMRVK
jgi:hypothetical protein